MQYIYANLKIPIRINQTHPLSYTPLNEYAQIKYELCDHDPTTLDKSHFDQ